MGFVSNVLSAAIGYGVSELSKSHPVKELIDTNFKSKKTLEDVIREYVKTNYGVVYTSNAVAKDLHRIAKTFETYDYHDF